MNLRAASLLLALTASLLCAPDGADAQARWRGGGFPRGAAQTFGAPRFARPSPGRPAGGRGGFAEPPFGGGYGAPAYGRGYAPPRGYGQDGYGRPPASYPRAPFNGGVYPPGAYGPPAFAERPYAPAEPAPGPAPRSFGGDWREQQNEVRQAVREGRHIPLGQAIDAVRRRSPGRELDADLVQGAAGPPA